MQFWSWGGWLLGFVTALMGPQGVWACTAAVEKAVHRHLDDQLFFLKRRDFALYAIIGDIREEELSHLHHAEQNLTAYGPWMRGPRSAIGAATDTLIWLSSWGDPTRLARALASAATR